MNHTHKSSPRQLTLDELLDQLGALIMASKEYGRGETLPTIFGIFVKDPVAAQSIRGAMRLLLAPAGKEPVTQPANVYLFPVHPKRSSRKALASCSSS